MKKINYLITAIILTFTLTLYARHSSTTSFNQPIKSSQQTEQLLPSFVKKLNSQANRRSLTSLESLLAYIVDIGK